MRKGINTARANSHVPIGSKRKTLLAVGIASMVALAFSGCTEGVTNEGGGSAVELTVVTAAQPGTPSAAVQDWYLDRVEEKSEGQISFQRTETESVCAATEIVECLRDGRADLGVTVPDYTPQYFSTVSVSGVPFAGQNSQAITQTLYDIHTENEQAIELLEQQGLHYVSTWPVGRFLFGSYEPVESIEDIDGLRVRSSGPVIQATLEGAGASIAAIEASESYEAVQRNMVDAVGAAMDFAVNYRLMELLPYWSDPGVGQYSTYGMWFSNGAYDSLDDDLKKIVDDVTQELNEGVGMEMFNDAAAEQCEQLTASGAVNDVFAWDEEATEAWEESVSETAKATWIELAKGYDLEDPESLLDEYQQGLEEHADAEYQDATLDCVANF